MCYAIRRPQKRSIKFETLTFKIIMNPSIGCPEVVEHDKCQCLKIVCAPKALLRYFVIEE